MSVLPDGSEFVSWEMPCSYDTVIHVNPAHKMSADNNDGSSETPLKTISEAARRAVAGTKVVIHQVLIANVFVLRLEERDQKKWFYMKLQGMEMLL